MQSGKFVELAHRIAVRDKAVFDALLEFEKTKKMQTKTRLNFTIDRSIASEFRRVCNREGYNMSARIEKMMDLEVRNSAKSK